MNFNFIGKNNKHKKLKSILFNNLKWEFALEVSNIGIWDFNATKNRVNFSKESAKILGYDVKDLNSDPQSWKNLVHPDDLTTYFSDFNNHLLGHNDIYENTSRVRHSNGSYRWILDKGKIIERTKNGKAKRVIGVHVDITDSQQKKDKILDSLALISSQNKKLKNFAHIASHNLKEHSANLESLLDLYKSTTNNSEKELLVDNINTVSNTLKKTIDNLRQVVSVNSETDKDIKSLELKKFVDNGIKNLMLDIGNTNAIIRNRIKENTKIYFNPLYLDSIIQNLLSNALKYAHPDRYSEIIISDSENDNYVILNVKDNGVGIDLKTYGNDIFGLYRTFHKNENAEGVGLYITKNQLESLGGSIAVESEVNKGSTFILKFAKIKSA